MTEEEVLAAIQPRPITKHREVYFVQAVTLGLIKIGVADDARKRLRDLAMNSPDRLRVLGSLRCSNFGRTERRLHDAFAHHRAHGEWFRAGTDLLQWIEANGTAIPRRIEILQAIVEAPRQKRGRGSTGLIRNGQRTVSAKLESKPSRGD